MSEKKYNSVEAYALAILAKHGCDCYTCGGESSKHVLEDLKEGYPDGMEYPYIDVANAILSISKVRPIVRAPFRMVWDTDTYCDGIDCESFGAAKCQAEDTLIEWMCQERGEWEDQFCPTEEELNNYNYMVYNSSVSVYKYDPDTDEYEEEWSPSYEEEEKLGWYELTPEILEKEKADWESMMKGGVESEG